MPLNYAISFFPISPQFKNQLESKLEAPINYLIIEQLRQQSLRKSWRLLRNLHAENLLFPIEFENHTLLLPVLKIISLFIPAKKINVVYQDLIFIKFHKFEILTEFLELIVYSFKACCSYIKNLIEIKYFIKTLPEEYTFNNLDKVLYLDSSVWLRSMTGGSVGHISGVVNALLRQNYNVDYAALLKLPVLSPQVNFIPIIPPKMFVLPTVLNHFTLNDNMTSQLLINSRNQYKFIYQRLASYNYSGIKLSRKLKIPLIIEYNGSPAWTSKHWNQKTLLNFNKHQERCEIASLKNAHLIVTVSEVLKEQLLALGISPEKNILLS